MTSEPDDYEALAYQVHEAGRQDWPKPWDQRPAAAILREWGEAKLAEVRAEADRYAGLLLLAQEKHERTTRTIAEQAAVIERLREALDPFARVAAIQGPLSANWPASKPNIEFISSVWPDWGDFARARTALQETADGK